MELLMRKKKNQPLFLKAHFIALAEESLNRRNALKHLAAHVCFLIVMLIIFGLGAMVIFA
jgi:predicted branched-subunit amino acid permease